MDCFFARLGEFFPVPVLSNNECGYLPPAPTGPEPGHGGTWIPIRSLLLRFCPGADPDQLHHRSDRAETNDERIVSPGDLRSSSILMGRQSCPPALQVAFSWERNGLQPDGDSEAADPWFPPHRFASLSGIVFSIGFIGNMASTTPFVLMVNLVGWRTALQIISGINFAPHCRFLPCGSRRIARRSSPSDKPLAPSLQESFNHLSFLLKKKDFWIIGYGSFCSYGIFAAFQALWAGPYLMEVMGLSAEAAGNVILLCNFALILGSPLCGEVSDRLLENAQMDCCGRSPLLGSGHPGHGHVFSGHEFDRVGPSFFLFRFFQSHPASHVCPDQGISSPEHSRDGHDRNQLFFHDRFGCFPSGPWSSDAVSLSAGLPWSGCVPSRFLALLGLLLSVVLVYATTKETKPRAS